MIRGFRHKGLSLYFETGSWSGIPPAHAQRIRLILARLDVANGPRDVGLPGLGLHPLKGDRDGRWAVKVSGNWRITFEFHEGETDAVDLEDYH